MRRRLVRLAGSITLALALVIPALPGTANAHASGVTGAKLVYATHQVCQVAYAQMDHLSGVIWGFPLTGYCAAHWTTPAIPTGMNIVAYQIWKNGDGRGGGQRVHASQWFLNYGTNPSYATYLGESHAWGSRFGPGKYTMDVATYHWWPHNTTGSWRGGIGADVTRHYY